jgi:hypothetical protein
MNNIVVYNWFELCVLVLIICDEMRFYIYSTRVVLLLCHEMFYISTAMHGYSTGVYIKKPYSRHIIIIIIYA